MPSDVMKCAYVQGNDSTCSHSAEADNAMAVHPAVRNQRLALRLGRSFIEVVKVFNGENDTFVCKKLFRPETNINNRF